ncbi:unnamed protein product, partial [Meganyctiphanes norvegica]
GYKNGYWCAICKIAFGNDENTIIQHFKSKKHVKKEARQQMLLKLNEEYDCLEHDPESGYKNGYWCAICKIAFGNDENTIIQHFKSKKHVKKEARQQMLLKLNEEYDCLEHDPESG